MDAAAEVFAQHEGQRTRHLMQAHQQTLANEDVRSSGFAVPPGCARSRAHFVRLFKPQFAPLVENGTKLQTVRPTPKRLPQPGDTISLRCWTGAPYRSKQRVLREAIIDRVRKIEIDSYAVTIDGVRLHHLDEEDFAMADGFSSVVEMTDWFRNTHGLPFSGIVLSWHNMEGSRDGR